LRSKYPRAIEYIGRLVREVASNAEVHLAGPDYRFIVKIGGDSTEVTFSEELMDDLDIALQKFQSTSYFHTLRNRVRYPILIALGSKGLIPNFKVSSDLLDESGEWLKNFRADVRFPSKWYETFDRGLELLAGFMAGMLSHGLRLPDVEADKRLVDSIREYYKEQGHFNSQGAELASLSFLKAAAFCVILEKEGAKSAQKLPRLRKALDQEIYFIVSIMREAPLADIRLPDIVQDYAAEADPRSSPKAPEYYRELPADPAQNRLDELLRKLDPRLVRRRQGAWEALRSSNPDRLSQAANSMVELLDQVIGQVCAGADLAAFLKSKYATHQKTEWVDATRKWISETKSNLHSTKHHTDPQSEQLTKYLLGSAELVILALIEPTQ
jgi:hypothetical protein